MRLAASNIGWAAEDDARVLPLMASLGYQGIEVAPTRLFPEDPYAHVGDFAAWSRRTQDRYGLAVCSLQSIWYGRAESVFDPAGASALLEYTRRLCEFARAGGVRNLVFGCPRNRRVPEGRDPREADGFLLECGRIAADAGCSFALEANPPMYATNFLNTTGEVCDLLERLGHPRGFAVNLDLGAVVAAGDGADAVARALPLASHVHVSEPGLVPPEARPLHGEVAGLLAGSGYGGYVSLEMGRQDLATAERALAYVAGAFGGGDR